MSAPSFPAIPPAVYREPCCPICDGELTSDPDIRQCEACCLYWPVDDPEANGEAEELDGPRCDEEHRPLEDDGYRVTDNGVVLFEGAVYRCIRLASHRGDDPAVCAGIKVAGLSQITDTLTWRTKGGAE